MGGLRTNQEHANLAAMPVVKLVDEMTLRSIIERGYGLSFECDNCWRLVAVDVLDLIGRLGAHATIGEVRRKLVCRRCNKSRARALIKTGNRKDEWMPTRPRAGR
jgi:hypothetical protein